MYQDDAPMDKYEYYEQMFDPFLKDRRVRQQRKPKPAHMPKISRGEIIAGLTDDMSDVDPGFNTTYRPSRHEEGWLLSSMQSFYEEGLISDVLALVKGGKEASVYRVEAHPSTGLGMLAAKVYRPRMFRNLRNDRMYRQGREILTARGKPAGRDSGYIQRAIRNKSAFGMQAAHTSWLMYEYTALEALYEAGGAVPRPIAASDNAILMSYHGDEYMAAPTLNTVDLDQDEAEVLFREVLRNVDLMLQQELVHGDLSAFNILYWQGEVTLIDFPQVVNLYTNLKARFILQRDLQRTCEYFAQRGVRCNPRAIMHEFWNRYVGEPDPEDVAADQSRLELILASLSEGAEVSPIQS